MLASLDYKQRLQQLFFPEGIASDGNRFNRTAATAPLFNYLAPSESADEKMVNHHVVESITLDCEEAGARSTRPIFSNADDKESESVGDGSSAIV